MGWALKNLVQSQRRTIAASLFTVTDDGESWINGRCPLHEDKEPSFGYNPEEDFYHCMAGCSKDGDLVDLFCLVNGYEQREGFIKFKEQFGDPSISPPPAKKSVPSTKKEDQQPQQNIADVLQQMQSVYNDFPSLADTWVKRLQVICGWSPDIIDELGLRYQTHYRDKNTGKLKPVRSGYGRIVIPIYDHDGNLANIRLYLPDGQPKILSWSGGLGANRLYPMPEIDKEGLVLICEGEKDTICARSHGFEAYTQTSKRMKWPVEQLRLFKNRDIMICYDADQPGAKYANAAASELAKVASSVRILNWPVYMLPANGKLPKKGGQDLTDFFVKHGKTVQDFQELFPLADSKDITENMARDSVWEFFGESITGRTVFQPLRLAERIIKDVSLLSDPKSGVIYRWNNKIWELYERDNVLKIASDYLEYESNSARVEDATKLACINSTIPPDREVNDRANMLCLKNGMLNLDTYKITPHRKEFYSTIMIPVTFDPKKPASCDKWLKFLETNIKDPDSIAQIQEFVGYCFTRDTRYGKCLINVGDGGDGKSLFQNILKKLVGEENITSVSFSDLNDKFERISLYGKLVNLSSEVGNIAMDSEWFKKIVTGDTITGSYKYKDSFSFKPYAKMLFAVNKLPKILDNTDGLFRRLIIIKYKEQYLEDDPRTDPDLEEKLTSELSGIFAWALAGLVRLRKQGKFTNSEESLDNIAEYRRLNNPVYAFVEDRMTIGDPEIHKVNKTDAYTKYKTYCNNKGYKHSSESNFFRELRVVVKNIKNYRPRVDGERQNWIKGISLSQLNEE